jgi:hypothetical protein
MGSGWPTMPKLASITGCDKVWGGCYGPRVDRGCTKGGPKETAQKRSDTKSLKGFTKAEQVETMGSYGSVHKITLNVGLVRLLILVTWVRGTSTLL